LRAWDRYGEVTLAEGILRWRDEYGLKTQEQKAASDRQEDL
jgi:hypothetical protein